MQIKDKVIIVTGGGQGLGRAMAEHLAERLTGTPGLRVAVKHRDLGRE